jgi:hypothetical protein
MKYSLFGADSLIDQVDKCYLVLTQAMRLGYGRYVYNSQALLVVGMALGRQVLVFNCDEVLGVFFVGLLSVVLAVVLMRCVKLIIFFFFFF